MGTGDTQIMAALGRIEGQNERQSARIDEIDRAIRGSQDGAVPGLMTRLDRVEQHQARVSWWSMTAAGAAVTAVAGSVWALVSGRSG